jgi:hypothetical protein
MVNLASQSGAWQLKDLSATLCVQEITSKFYAKLADIQAEKAASLREGGLGAGEDAEPSLGVAP